MKRYMVDPLNFGTQSGYPWAATVPVNQPHTDQVHLFTLDHSIRLWEPARWSLGAEESAGLLQLEDGSLQQQADLPGALGIQVIPQSQAVEIHGFKGDIWIQMGDRVPPAGGDDPNPLGEWTDDADGVSPIVVQDARAWEALGGGDNPLTPGLFCPVFIAMYRGTYRQLDDLQGWEIDSGPADDPDTLLGVDITSPTVLESSRIDWWTRVDVPYPRVNWSYITPPAGRAIIPQAVERRQTVVKVPMDLTRNVKLGANQVLWLHIRTGVNRAWVFAGDDPDGNYTPALYRNHSFHCWNTMSALVSPLKGR